ncbi:MAG: tetratricopeptide repeat protein [Planctomycetota bacterium]
MRHVGIVPLLACLLVSFLAGPASGQSDEEIDRLVARGERFVTRGQWSRARPLLERAHAADAEDREVEDKLLLCQWATGQWDDLEKLSARRLEREPRSVAILVERVEILRDLGRHDDALDLVERFQGVEKGGFWLESWRALLLTERGRLEEAAKIHEALVDRAKEVIVREAADLVGLARAYRSYPHGGDYAEEALVSAIKKDPDFLAAYVELAGVFSLQKESPIDVKKEFNRALERRPNWPDYLVGIAASADLRLGMAEGEKREYTSRALEVNPRHPDALFLLGARRLGDGQWKKAEENFEAGLAVNPGHRDCLSGFAAAAFFTGRTAEYEARRAAVFARDPKFGRFHQILADTLNDRRRWREAFEQMKVAVEVNPKNPRLWDDLARYALYIGEEEVGRDALKKADDLVHYGTVWRNNMAMVMDLLAKEYETVPTEHFALKLHRDDRAVLEPMFTRSVERSWAEFVERYGFEPSSPIVFDVFQRSKDFSVRTMGVRGLPALGVCFGTTVAMDAPRARRAGTYNWEATSHHEIAHVFTLQLSRGRVPRWLTEGISSWEEVRREASWGRDMETELHDAYMNDELLGVLEFDAAFTTPRIGYAYYQGGLCAEWLEKTFGIEKVVAMLKLYATDVGTERVISQVLKIDAEEFDRRFRDFVAERLAPLRRMPNWSDASMERFRAAIEAGRDVTENRIRLAWAYEQRNLTFDADATLAPIVKEGVSDPRIDLMGGRRAVAGKRFEVAREKLEGAVKAGLEDVDLYITLAHLDERDGKSDSALGWWEKAAAAHPWYAEPGASPFLAIARLKKAGGDLEGWAHWTRVFCDLVDIAVPPRQELLAYHLSRDDKEAALAIHRELELVVPLDPALRIARAKLLLEMDDKDAARLQFLSAVALKPKPPVEIEARLALGKLYVELGDPDEASYHFARVVELDSENEEARRALRELDDMESHRER